LRRRAREMADQRAREALDRSRSSQLAQPRAAEGSSPGARSPGRFTPAPRSNGRGRDDALRFSPPSTRAPRGPTASMGPSTAADRRESNSWSSRRSESPRNRVESGPRLDRQSADPSIRSFRTNERGSPDFTTRQPRPSRAVHEQRSRRGAD
jgi:hypothetical protein